MNDKPVWYMIAFGMVRHVLTIAGTYLLTRGLIDEDTHTRLLSEGVTQIVGWLLIVVPLAWSWLQKRQSWGWVKTALRLDARTAPAAVPSAAPGPDIPL